MALARRVYDLCAKQSVYPVPSQFNRMMDVYASEFRWGVRGRGRGGRMAGWWEAGRLGRGETGG